MEDPKEVQEKVFRRQMAIAREHQLPISIHTCEALEDTYAILKDEKSKRSAASCTALVGTANGRKVLGPRNVYFL